MREADYEFLDEEVPYREFADLLLATCLVNDPWYDGVPIFRSAPVVISDTFQNRLYEMAERIGRLYQELSQIVHREPKLLESFFSLPPHYKLMWLASDGLWHGFARLDAFLTREGEMQVCELNADTPSGQVEALVPNELIRDDYVSRGVDPNAAYEQKLWDVICAYHQKTKLAGDAPTSIGILYPTDLPEDITLIQLYRQWFEARGVRVVLGAPQNLQLRDDGGVLFLGEPVDCILRHYKTDWWGERPRIFGDEDEVPNAEPLKRELMTILEAERNQMLSVVNPFGALIPQDKLSMAFMWEEMARFSEDGQRAIKDLIPKTQRLDVMDREQLSKDKDLWVIKSDFGCEGDEVIVGVNTDQALWDETLAQALPGIWVVQRFFDVRPVTLNDEAGERPYLPNWGVYLVGGRAAGLLVRVAPLGITTGEDARVVPVLVSPVARSVDQSPSLG